MKAYASAFLMGWIVAAPIAAVIPNADNDDAYVQARLVQDKLAFNRRHIAEAYHQIGNRDDRWDELALTVLEYSAAVSANFSVNSMHQLEAIEKEEVLAAIDQLATLGCDDPLVRYWATANLIDWRDSHQNARAASAHGAYLGLVESDYSTYRKAMGARLWLGELNPGHPGYPEAATAFSDRLIALLEDPDARPEDERFYYQLIGDLEDRMTTTDRLTLYERAKAVDTRFVWLRGMLGGDLYKDLAWNARGGGFANTVTEDGWRGFRENLVLSHNSLLGAWKARPEYPEAPTRMISVSMGLSDGNERLWFDRAVTAQFDYWPAYSAYRWSIRPRWHGSLDMLYAFGVECLDTGRFDTVVPHNYHSALNNIKTDVGDHSYLRRPGVFEDYVRYLDGKADSPKSASPPRWWHSKKVAVAWKAGRPDEGKALLLELGNEFDPKTIRDFDGDPRLVVSELHLHGTPGQDALEQSRRLYMRGDLHNAADVLGDALADLGPNHPGRPYLRHAYRLTHIATQDRDGQWIEMTGQPDLAGWTVHGGEWSVDLQGRWVGKSDDTGYVEGLLLRPAYDFGPRVEVYATVTFLEKNGGVPNAGVFFDIEKDDSSPHHHNVTVRPDRDEVHLAHQWKRNLKAVPCLVDDTATLHIQRWDEQVRVVVDGVPVFDRVGLPGGNADDVHALGVGGKAWEPGLTVRFDRLVVRRVPEMPDWVRGWPAEDLPPPPLHQVN